MSAFDVTVVRDSRVQDISSKGHVQVRKGAAESNFQQVNANSVSTSNVNFSVVVPSESIVVDRHMTMTSTQTLRITIPTGHGKTAGRVFKYGENDALQAFPLNCLIQNATTTINQTSISTQTQDIMAPLLKMSEDEIYSKYACPHMTDSRFKSFADMILCDANPLADYSKSKGKAIPRGSHSLDSFIITKTGTGGAVRTQASAIGDIQDALTCEATDNAWTIDLTYTTTEPLLFLSPFLAGERVENNAGLYGVRNIDLTLNLDSSAKRAFSRDSTGFPATIALTGISNCKLNLNYLTTQDSELIASKNVVPYTEYQRYLTVDQAQLASGSSRTLQSQAIQLNQIPSKIYVVCRKRMADQTMYDSNSFWPISQVSVNFNNKSGILAGASVSDLYQMSVANGSKQLFYEFSGHAGAVEGVTKYSAGSVLVIDPSRDLCLPDYLASGSIGSYSFAMQLTVKNTDDEALAPELMIVMQYCGLFSTQSGISSKQTGVLTKDVVVSAVQSQFGEPSKYVQERGWDNLANRGLTSSKNTPLLNSSKSGGSARSGGAMSGGALSHVTY